MDQKWTWTGSGSGPELDNNNQGQWYDVQVSLRENERGLAYFGHDWESRVIERFVK